MSEIHEAIEKAKEGEHGEGFNRKIALVIAILALFLSFSETLGKGAQTEADHQEYRSLGPVGVLPGQEHPQDAGQDRGRGNDGRGRRRHRSGRQGRDAKSRSTPGRRPRARYEFGAATNDGRKELEEQAKDAEEERDLSMAKYHHYELSSAAFQVGIVLASAAVITGMVGLAWLAGALGVVGLALLALGLFAPHAVPLIATL